MADCRAESRGDGRSPAAIRPSRSACGLGGGGRGRAGEGVGGERGVVRSGGDVGQAGMG